MEQKKLKIELIKWKDACKCSEEYSVGNTGLWELEEVGWVVAETEEYITLAMERESGDENPKSVRLWISIPKVLILSRKELIPDI